MKCPYCGATTNQNKCPSCYAAIPIPDKKKDENKNKDEKEK